jgi:ligand-binding sensor domain-containing protein
VHTLYEGRDGTIWVAATTGLWRLDRSGTAPTLQQIEPEPSSPVARIARIWDLIEDRQGNLWMATSRGLAVRSPAGIVSARAVAGERVVECYSVLEDRDGAIWAGHDEGVTIFDPNGTTRSFRSDDGIGDGLISDLMQSADGKIWLAPVKGGLTEFDGERFRHYVGWAFSCRRPLRKTVTAISGSARWTAVWCGWLAPVLRRSPRIRDWTSVPTRQSRSISRVP